MTKSYELIVFSCYPPRDTMRMARHTRKARNGRDNRCAAHPRCADGPRHQLLRSDEKTESERGGGEEKCGGKKWNQKEEVERGHEGGGGWKGSDGKTRRGNGGKGTWDEEGGMRTPQHSSPLPLAPLTLLLPALSRSIHPIPPRSILLLPPIPTPVSLTPSPSPPLPLAPSLHPPIPSALSRSFSPSSPTAPSR